MIYNFLHSTLLSVVFAVNLFFSVVTSSAASGDTVGIEIPDKPIPSNNTNVQYKITDKSYIDIRLQYQCELNRGQYHQCFNMWQPSDKKWHPWKIKYYTKCQYRIYARHPKYNIFRVMCDDDDDEPLYNNGNRRRSDNMILPPKQRHIIYYEIWPRNTNFMIVAQYHDNSMTANLKSTKIIKEILLFNRLIYGIKRLKPTDGHKLYVYIQTVNATLLGYDGNPELYSFGPGNIAWAGPVGIRNENHFPYTGNIIINIHNKLKDESDDDFRVRTDRLYSETIGVHEMQHVLILNKDPTNYNHIKNLKIYSGPDSDPKVLFNGRYATPSTAKEFMQKYYDYKTEYKNITTYFTGPMMVQYTAFNELLMNDPSHFETTVNKRLNNYDVRINGQHLDLDTIYEEGLLLRATHKETDLYLSHMSRILCDTDYYVRGVCESVYEVFNVNDISDTYKADCNLISQYCYNCSRTSGGTTIAPVCPVQKECEECVCPVQKECQECKICPEYRECEVCKICPEYQACPVFPTCPTLECDNNPVYIDRYYHNIPLYIFIGISGLIIVAAIIAVVVIIVRRRKKEVIYISNPLLQNTTNRNINFEY